MISHDFLISEVFLSCIYLAVDGGDDSGSHAHPHVIRDVE